MEGIMHTKKNSLFFTFYEKLGHVFIKMRM